ncbi:MAG: hypothetical protein L0Y71_01315 [Gemmataceae bacterium]|nr:hypothetical protein [Gemmataceae bacterium]
MARLHLLAAALIVIAAEPAAAQTHRPAVRASLHDQDGDGKADKINATMWQGLLRRGTNRADRAVAEFDLSALRGRRLAEVVLEFELAVNNAGGASVREFDVVVYAGTGKVDLDTFTAKAQLIRRISFSIQANPATYRLDADRQVQAVLDGKAKFVGIRFDPVGDANFPSILTEVALIVQTEADAAAAREIAALIQRLGADEFKEREAAATELVKRGARARPQLDKAQREARDAEIRQRVRAILDRINRERRQSKD